MKDQLQLQEIAGYLPYKLTMYAPHGFRPNYKESTGTQRVVYLTGDLYADLENNTYQGAEFKPILRPMSDFLISDNLYDCNRIMHNEEYDKAISHVEYIIESGNYFDARLLPSCFVDLMKKEHIDFQDLIGRGLAISIHDIPTKP